MEFSAFDEFDNHHKVVFCEKKDIGLKAFIAIHRYDGSHPALGATRLWDYASEEEALKDALRLSRLMSYKAKAAGLAYTGAKATIMYTKYFDTQREEIFREYAKFVERLEGMFVTGTDVGLRNDDLDYMMKETSYIIGKGVNSAYYNGPGRFASDKGVFKKSIW